MLTLTRRIGERIVLGQDIEIIVLSARNRRVRLGISAPRDLPVHRGELVDTITEENRRALEQQGVDTESEDGIIIELADGLFGMREHRRFRLYDAPGEGPLRILVSAEDSTVQLFVADANELCSDYPVDEARRAAGIASGEEVAVALVVRIHADGSGGSVNLAAPIVIGVTSRQGAQVILDRDDLGVAHPLQPAGAGANGHRPASEPVAGEADDPPAVSGAAQAAE